MYLVPHFADQTSKPILSLDVLAHTALVAAPKSADQNKHGLVHDENE